MTDPISLERLIFLYAPFAPYAVLGSVIPWYLVWWLVALRTRTLFHLNSSISSSISVLVLDIGVNIGSDPIQAQKNDIRYTKKTISDIRYTPRKLSYRIGSDRIAKTSDADKDDKRGGKAELQIMVLSRSTQFVFL